MFEHASLGGATPKPASSAPQDVLAHGGGAYPAEIQERRHAAEHAVHVARQLEDVARPVEQELIGDVPGGGPRLLHDALERRGVRRQRLQHHVADVAGAGLHRLRHRRLRAVPALDPLLVR